MLIIQFKQKLFTYARNIIVQSTIVTTYLVHVFENMSEIVSLEITFKGRFNKVNKVLSFDTSTNMPEITSLETLSKNLWLNIGSCLWTRL